MTPAAADRGPPRHLGGGGGRRHRARGPAVADYDYDGVQTCAVDGMCQTACPVLINTGDLVKRLRRDAQPVALATAWTQAAKHWSGFTRAGSTALTVADRLPGPAQPVAVAATEVARRILGADRVPRWSPELPAGGPRRHRPAAGPKPDAVYLPSCVGALFGPTAISSGGDRAGVQVAFERLCARGRDHPARAGGDRRPVLRYALVVQGATGRAAGDGRARTTRGSCGVPRWGAARGHRRELLHPGVRRPAGRRRRRARPAGGRRRDLRGRPSAAPAGRTRPVGLGLAAPHLLLDPARPERRPDPSRRGGGAPGAHAAGVDVLRLRRGPGSATSRADDLRHRSGSRRGQPQRSGTRTPPATAPASSA